MTRDLFERYHAMLHAIARTQDAHAAMSAHGRKLYGLLVTGGIGIGDDELDFFVVEVQEAACVASQQARFVYEQFRPALTACAEHERAGRFE